MKLNKKHFHKVNEYSKFGSLFLTVAILRMLGSDDERSGLAGVCRVIGSERYFEYAVVNEVWHIEPIL